MQMNCTEHQFIIFQLSMTDFIHTHPISNVHLHPSSLLSMVFVTSVIKRFVVLPKKAPNSWIAVNSTALEAAMMVVRCIPIRSCATDGSDGIMLRFSQRSQSGAGDLTCCIQACLPRYRTNKQPAQQISTENMH